MSTMHGDWSVFAALAIHGTKPVTARVWGNRFRKVRVHDMASLVCCFVAGAFATKQFTRKKITNVPISNRLHPLYRGKRARDTKASL